MALLHVLETQRKNGENLEGIIKDLEQIDDGVFASEKVRKYYYYILARLCLVVYGKNQMSNWLYKSSLYINAVFDDLPPNESTLRDTDYLYCHAYIHWRIVQLGFSANALFVDNFKLALTSAVCGFKYYLFKYDGKEHPRLMRILIILRRLNDRKNIITDDEYHLIYDDVE